MNIDQKLKHDKIEIFVFWSSIKNGMSSREIEKCFITLPLFTLLASLLKFILPIYIDLTGELSVLVDTAGVFLCNIHE